MTNDFTKWRKENGRNNLSRIALDMTDFMEERLPTRIAKKLTKTTNNHKYIFKESNDNGDYKSMISQVPNQEKRCGGETGIPLKSGRQKQFSN